jgi:hypothetical protein
VDLYEELAGIVDLLNESGVEYAVCGGLAVALHGHPRLTKDLDLLVLPEDVPRIQGLMARLGYDLPPARLPFAVGTERERRVVRITKIEGRAVFSVDLLLVTPIFRQVWQNRKVFEWRGRTLQVVSLEGLAFMKRLAGRHQDLADLENLGLLDEGEDGQDA